MKRELGIARCGLACCLCSENVSCQGCDSGQCPDKDWCENRKCSIEKGYFHCYSCCNEECRKGLLSKIKPYGFFCLLKDMERKPCWIAWNVMKKMVLYTIVRELSVIMMNLMM